MFERMKSHLESARPYLPVIAISAATVATSVLVGKISYDDGMRALGNINPSSLVWPNHDITYMDIIVNNAVRDAANVTFSWMAGSLYVLRRLRR